VLALGVVGAARAGDGEWTLRLEPMHMQAVGHDQHVLNIHEIDLDVTPPVDSTTGINLDTDTGIAYRFELKYTRRQWGWGVDFFWFNTSQSAGRLTRAGDGASGLTDQVVFEVADRSYSSTSPNELLYYEVLEDTDITAWTVDLYGIRTLVDRPRSGIHLLFGIRSGDFDNDYRAVVGVEGVGGSRLDASSNYDRMTGPIVGLAGDFHVGRHGITGSIGQSVLFGSVELDSMTREFTGPFRSGRASLRKRSRRCAT
jgi:hypothetical protein